MAVVLGMAPACGKGKTETAPAAPAAAPAEGATPGAEGEGPRKIDLSDSGEIEDIAKRAIQAYSRKDPEGLAAVGPPGAKEKTIFIEPRNPNYEALFGDSTWNMRSVLAWDERIRAIERGIDAAYAIYHEDGEFRYAVELHKFDDGWKFYHLKQLPLTPAGGIVVNPGATGGQ
jgi:hypothetical protein